MSNIARGLALAALLVAQSPAHGQTQDLASTRSAFSVGVKSWANNWDTWVTSRTGTGVALGTQRYQTVQALDSDLEVSAIPFVSYRRGDLFVSLSAMTRTRYQLLDAATPGGFEVGASREEADLNSGYFFAPGLAVTAGVKRLKQTYGPDRYTWQGPIVGLSGAANVSGPWSLYGTAALGHLKARFPTEQADSRGNTRFSADYRLGEFGVVYATGPLARFVRAAVFTVGYRMQNVSTKDYGLATTDPQGNFVPNVNSNLKDTTQGLAVGLTIVF